MIMRISKRTPIVLVFVVVLSVAGALAYYQLLKAGFVHYGRYDHRDRGSLRVGGTAPDLDLTMYDGKPVRLSQLWGERPLFLVFGSCT